MISRTIGLTILLATLAGCGGSDTSATDAAALSQACTTADDCSGVLPYLCQVCSNGQTACAHFACVTGRCETQVCP